MTSQIQALFFVKSYYFFLNHLFIQSQIQVTFDSREYDKLFELIKLLAGKRGQPKKALIDMVQLSMSFIEKMPTEELKIQLITTIKDVCEKKIFLEVRLISIISLIIY